MSADEDPNVLFNKIQGVNLIYKGTALEMNNAELYLEAHSKLPERYINAIDDADTKYKQAYPASTETDFKYLKKRMHNFWTRMNSASSGGEMALFLLSQSWANGGNNGGNGGGWNNPHQNKDC